MPSANRAMRRKQAKIDQKKAQLYKNGITNSDLVKEYEKGYRDGMQNGGKPIIERYYAATMMALHDLYGFGQQRCIKTLRRVEECLIENLTDLDLMKEVEKKLGIEIVMDEAIDRAQPI